MKVQIEIDTSITSAEILIKTPHVNDEINTIVNTITKEKTAKVRGYMGETVTSIYACDILRIYALQGKVYAQTPNGDYILKTPLYETANTLADEGFIRISNYEIINLKKVKSFDVSLSKTIAITMNNDQVTHVSRRYVSTVKPYLLPREKAEDFPLLVLNLGAFIDVIIFDEKIIEELENKGFSKYESDLDLWKENQYGKRLNDFSPEIIEQWISYFVSLGAVFASGNGWCPKDLLEDAIEKGKVKLHEYYSIGFTGDGRYTIHREKIET